MSTFSEHNSFRITSGAIHATVPANDILVLFSFQVLWVPKSEILTTSFLPIRTLKLWIEDLTQVFIMYYWIYWICCEKAFKCLTCAFYHFFCNKLGKKEIKCEAYNIILALQNTDIINRGSYMIECFCIFEFINREKKRLAWNTYLF